MTPERWETIKRVFDSALDLEPESRESYLRDACKGDADLYAEADRLVREFDAAGGFLDGNLFQTTSTLSCGDVIAGRYFIARLLGRGGMGEVYEARDQLLGETVALKTLRAGLAGSPSTLRRFQGEIQLARKVTHPNVCRIYEVGVDEKAGSGQGLHFFVMEYLAGETLADRLRREGRLTKAQAFPIAAQIAEGLAAAHRAGIVHRDLKSANVMLVPEAGGDRAVLTDFGLARVEMSGTTSGPASDAESEMAIAGTVGYMSPEQFTGGEITAASDIYSFGIVLFEMASGRLPFDDQHLIRAAVQRANRDTAPIRTLAPDIDERWKTAIARCLEGDPKKRPQSAERLAEWFRKDGWRVLVQHWSARQWIRAGAAAAISIAAVAGLWIWTHPKYAPSDDARRWYDKGLAAMHGMTFEAARKDLEQAVAIDSRFALAHAALAEACAELDYGERANSEMLKAQSASDETLLSSKDAQRFKALRFMVTRDFDRAAEIYAQLEKEAAGSERVGAALDTGFALEKKDDLPGAVAEYSKATQLDPQDPAAKLRLGFMQGRQRKVDAALASFASAESLYTAASDFEGVTEIDFRRAQLLNRSSRSEETVAEIEKALRITEATGNPYQRIRLQLLEGVAYRNLGNTDRAAALAREAVETATNNGMENTAAAGLIDLGNSYVAKEDLKPAEGHFQEALRLAKRSEARQSEARAELSLANLRLQHDRPGEAKPLVEAASSFYRTGGYRRETVQSLLLLGEIHEELAEFFEGEAVLRETVEAAGHLNDSGVAGDSHLALGSILSLEGSLPQALKEFETAAKLHRTGRQYSHDRLESAAIYWRLGRGGDSDKAFDEVGKLLKDPQFQSQLRASFQEYGAERAYETGQYELARQLASDAARLDTDKNLKQTRYALLEGLATIRLGRVAEGSKECERALQAFEQGTDVAGLARARLSLARALLQAKQTGKARELAQSALEFFEPTKLTEQIWQAERVLAEASGNQQHYERARSALTDLSNQWPREDFKGYLNEIQKSGISMAWFQLDLRVKK